jgi:hypothetical protein
MAGTLGDCARLPGKPDNRPDSMKRNPVRVFSIPGRARRCNRGRLSQHATGTGETRPGRRGRPDDPKARRRVESFREACGQGFAVAFHERRREALLLFLEESDAFEFQHHRPRPGAGRALQHKIDRRPSRSARSVSSETIAKRSA